MADYWPTAEAEDPSNPAYEIEFARIWKQKPKIVFSKTLEEAEPNTRIIRENTAEEVAKLKQEPGSDLIIGGAEIASTLMRHGLVDEYLLYVHPVVVGGGKPLFPTLETSIDLRLVESHAFGTGVVLLHYA